MMVKMRRIHGRRSTNPNNVAFPFVIMERLQRGDPVRRSVLMIIVLVAVLGFVSSFAHAAAVTIRNDGAYVLSYSLNYQVAHQHGAGYPEHAGGLLAAGQSVTIDYPKEKSSLWLVELNVWAILSETQIALIYNPGSCIVATGTAFTPSYKTSGC